PLRRRDAQRQRRLALSRHHGGDALCNARPPLDERERLAWLVGDAKLARVRLLTVLVVLSVCAPAFAAHPVFDLVANRNLAHAERNGALSIAAGSPGFARYIHFSRPLPTWKLRVVEDGKKVALAQTQAWLEVPLTAAEAKGATLTLRL